MNKTLKKYWWLSLVFIALTTMISFSCLSGDDDDDDDNNTDDGTLGACCSVSNECSIDERTACKADGGRWLGEEIRCAPDPCGDDDDDDDDNDDDNNDDSGDDDVSDDDSGDDDTGWNHAPILEEALWFVNSYQETYPAYATATTADTVGVGFIWNDEDCNLIGGYGTVTMTVDGVEEAPQEVGPYEDIIGCSHDESGMAIGFFFTEPTSAGVYEWVFTATDSEGATSQEQTGTFTITEYGDDDDDDIFPDDDDDTGGECAGNTAPTYEDTIWVVNGSQQVYPTGATATTADQVGVGFIWDDAECNLIGGYSTLVLTVNGVEEAPVVIGPYSADIGCSTNQGGMLIGFFYDVPLAVGLYNWVFTSTDACDATSIVQTGTFTITEYGDDDDDTGGECAGNTAPTFEDTMWIVNETQEVYPTGATATIYDMVGVGFAFDDAECNLIGGYGTATITFEGHTESYELGPYDYTIGCSTEQSQQIIGFFYAQPLPAGVYDWTFTATDVCDATSEEVSGTFTIIE